MILTMPKVKPLTAEYQIEYEWERLSEKIYLDCRRLKIKNKDLAKEIGITPEAVSHQFTTRRVQVPTILAYERLKGGKQKCETF